MIFNSNKYREEKNYEIRRTNKVCYKKMLIYHRKLHMNLYNIFFILETLKINLYQ